MDQNYPSAKICISHTHNADGYSIRLEQMKYKSKYTDCHSRYKEGVDTLFTIGFHVMIWLLLLNPVLLQYQLNLKVLLQKSSVSIIADT